MVADIADLREASDVEYFRTELRHGDELLGVLSAAVVEES
jgi:hypothetical protein